MGYGLGVPPTRFGPAAACRAGRRRLLGLGLGLPLAAWGCTVSDPTIDPPGTTGPPPTGTPPAGPPPLSGAGAAAVREQTLAGMAGALARAQRDPDRRRLLAGIRDGHREHAAVLAGPDPLGRARPTPLPGARTAGSGTVQQLAAAERAAAAAYRATALGTGGLPALLWGSLSVCAVGFDAALRSDPEAEVAPAPTGTRASVPVLEAVAAAQSLLRQLHAVVYGYQVAAGRLPAASRAYRRAQQGLRLHQRHRDQLTDLLRDREAEVPPAEPAYEVRVRDAAGATRLIRTMEQALAPHCGLWLASAGAVDRPAALTLLSRAVAAARAWGAPVPVWPGWPG